MKRITPVLLTALSVLVLSLPLTSQADNDGFLVFEATDATQASIAAPAAEVIQATVPEAAVQAPEVIVEATTADVTASPAQVQEVVVKAPKAEIKVAKKAQKKSQKRSKRTERKKRSTRAKRSQRSSLRKTKYYRIRKGDTLYRISVKSGVRLSRLVSLNKLHGSKKHNIQAGQRIRLR